MARSRSPPYHRPVDRAVRRSRQKTALHRQVAEVQLELVGYWVAMLAGCPWPQMDRMTGQILF